MATVIDSLIVTLGLDPSGFTKGQKQAAASFMKTRDAALKTGKEIEESSKRTANAIHKVARQAVLLFGAIAGSRTFVDFVGSLNTANAALGRFASNMATPPQRIAAWGMAAERVGGSAQATAASFERVSQALHDLHNGAKMLPPEYSRLIALSKVEIRRNNGVDVFMTDLAKAAHTLGKTDPNRAYHYVKALGLDEGTINLMIRHGDQIGKELRKLEGYAPSDAAIKAAQDLQESWRGLQQVIIGLANKIAEVLGPKLAAAIDQFKAWIDKNEEWIKTGLVDAVESLAKWLADIDWSGIGTGMSQFASAANSAATAVGGLEAASVALLTLWTGSKVLQAVANMRALGGGGGGRVAGGIGRGGLLGGVLAAFAVVGMSIPADERKQRWEDFKEHNRRHRDGLTARSGAGSFERGGRNRGRGHASPGMPYSTLTERVLHPSLMNENLLRGGGGTSGLGGGAGNDRLNVDGRPVSRANPMPVMLGNGSTGGGFWDGFWKWASGGNSGATGGTEPGGSGGIWGAAKRFLGLEGSSPAGSDGTRAGSATPGWWTAERQRHAYNRLREEAGLSHEGAMGLVSRWAHVEATQGPGAVNPTSGAFGIAQWLGPRKGKIAGNTNYDDQLSYAIWELQNTETKAAAALRAAKSKEDGAVGAAMYERAEGYNPRTGRDNHVAKTLGGMNAMEAILSGDGISTPLGRFNPNVDQRLRNIIDETARRTGTNITLNSGMRPGDRRFHGRGKALDISILGPDGKPMPNYQSAEAFATYEAFAHEARRTQRELYPELNKKFRWGGYFSGGKGRYGALDLMHFDIGGAGMGGGSWEGGLTPEQRALWPGARSRGMMDLVDGARSSRMGSVSNDNSQTSTSQTNFGDVTVNLPGVTNAEQFASQLGPALQGTSVAKRANSGPQ